MKKIFILATLLLTNLSLQAAFTNGGTISGNKLHLSYSTLDNQGTLRGKESITLLTDTLTGKGLISAPNITIKTALFAFTGTIDCSESCTIIAKAPFNPACFKRKGEGEFSIIIDPNFAKGFKIQPFKDKFKEIIDDILEDVEEITEY